MKGVKVAAAAAEMKADNSMVIGGGIHPWFASEQEGKLRASAVIVKKDIKICVVSCDVLMIARDILDEACREIEDKFGIPFENILIAATHTHHAPTVVTLHGYERDETFSRRVKHAILSAVGAAEDKLKHAGKAKMHFWVGNESTVGQNSRLLLPDHTIYWTGPREDALRPTGPFDPELPVVAFRKEDEILEALLFNHSTHNIGTRRSGIRSPGFYGLAAQELEEELGGTVIFLAGAFGSTHDLTVLGGALGSAANTTLRTEEAVFRIKNAVKEAHSESVPRDVPQIVSVKKEFEYKVRKFDEKKEDEAVSYYCNKRLTNPDPVIEVFRKMRKELAEHQGEVRRSWLQAMLLGDVVLVGVPGELFTKLGIQIKSRSPFRYTYVVALANDWIGYIPEKEAYDLGGYQLWTGLHSFVEKGTGEAVVEKATQMLSNLHSKYSC
jgi:phosphoribosylformylglycinamidine (FGAM) synthase PurS component